MSIAVDTPEYYCLRLLPLPHEQIDLCGQVIKMRLGRLWRPRRRYTCVLVTSLLILLRTQVIHVRKRLERVDYDEVRGPNMRIRQVSAEAGLKDVENGVVGRVDGRCACGRDEVCEITRAHCWRRCRRHGRGKGG